MMRGFTKLIREFSNNDVTLEENWKYVIEIDKENDMVVIQYFEIDNNEMKLQDTYCINECAELLFKTIAKDFDR